MRGHSDWTSRKARLSSQPSTTGLDGEYHPEAGARLLHALLSPARILDPRGASDAAAIVQALGALSATPEHPWRRVLDGLHDQARFFDVIRAPAQLADAVARLRAQAIGGNGSPVRSAQATMGMARTLATSTGHTTLAATAASAGTIPLDLSALRIAGAHSIPLVTLPTSQAAIARQLAENLVGWQAALGQRRKDWAAERAESEHRVRALGAEDFDALVHAREEVRTLASVLESLSRREPAEMPEPLALDRALADVAGMVANWALPRWLTCGEVAVPLLAFVAGSRTSRPFVPTLVKEGLARGDLPVEVTRALVNLGAAKLTGLTREEAWLGTEGVNRVTRGDETARALDDVEAVLEADGHLREVLWSFALRAGADASARRAAARAVLHALPSNRVSRVAEALGADAVVQRAALTWVVEAREHGAYDVLAAWTPSSTLRPLWYLAVASTGDQRAMQLLSPRLAEGDDEAEKAVIKAGMRLAASQVRLRREIESRRGPRERMRAEAREAASAERSALDAATRAGGELADQRQRAVARRQLLELKVVESQLEAAMFSVRLEPALVLAERLLRRLEDEKSRLDAARQRLIQCQRQLSGTEGAARQCQVQMATERQNIQGLTRGLHEARSEVQRASNRVERANREVSEARASAEAADAAVLRAGSPQAMERARGQAQNAGRRVDDALDGLASARRELGAAEVLVRSLSEALEAANERLAALEQQADRLQALLRTQQVELRHAQAEADRCQRTCEATERELDAARKRVRAIADEAAAAAKARDVEVASVRASLEQVLAAARRSEAGEAKAIGEGQVARDRRRAAEVEVQRLTGLDLAALQQHEREIEPAAEELARLDVAHRARSDEAHRRARAVQALSVSADVLYSLVHAIDGVSPPIQPYARRLAGHGAKP